MSSPRNGHGRTLIRQAFSRTPYSASAQRCEQLADAIENDSRFGSRRAPTTSGSTGASDPIRSSPRTQTYCWAAPYGRRARRLVGLLTGHVDGDWRASRATTCRTTHPTRSGTVSPHDNAIIANGCSRYGHDDAERAGWRRALLDAAGTASARRLPKISKQPRARRRQLLQYMRSERPAASASEPSRPPPRRPGSSDSSRTPTERLVLEPEPPDWLGGALSEKPAAGVGGTSADLAHQVRGWSEVDETRGEI